MKIRRTLLTTVSILLLTFALSTFASATCNTLEQSLSTFTDYPTAAALIVAPATGCTLVVDAVSASVYAGSVDYTVAVVGISGSSCTAFNSVLDSFPIYHNQVPTNRNYVTPQNGGLDMAFAGPKVCVYFSSISSGAQQYITIQYHQH